METLANLLDFVSPKTTKLPETNTERLFTAGVALLAALACGALWGLCSGTGAQTLALRNLAVVPILMVASMTASLPVGLLVFRLLAREGRVTDLVLAYASSIFAGGLVLLFLAPIVALYHLSSTWAGPWVSVASVVIAFITGFAVMMRTLVKLTNQGGPRPFLIPTVALVILQIASLAQLSSLAPPLMQERTRFGHGIDGTHSPSSAVGTTP